MRRIIEDLEAELGGDFFGDLRRLEKSGVHRLEARPVKRVAPKHAETADGARAEGRRIQVAPPAGVGERIADQIDAIVTVAAQAAVGAGGDVDRRAGVEREDRVELPALRQSLPVSSRRCRCNRPATQSGAA
jgi:hypothetical protein